LAYHLAFPPKIGDPQTLLIYATGLGPVESSDRHWQTTRSDGPVLHNTVNSVNRPGKAAFPPDVKFAGMSPAVLWESTS